MSGACVTEGTPYTTLKMRYHSKVEATAPSNYEATAHNTRKQYQVWQQSRSGVGVTEQSAEAHNLSCTGGGVKRLTKTSQKGCSSNDSGFPLSWWHVSIIASQALTYRAVSRRSSKSLRYVRHIGRALVTGKTQNLRDYFCLNKVLAR